MTDLKLLPVLDFSEENSADRWALQGMHDVAAAVGRDHYGHDDFTDSLDVYAQNLARSEYYTKQAFVVIARGSRREPGSVLGWMQVDMPKTDDTHVAYFRPHVSPTLRAFQTREVFALLAEKATQVAGEYGRTTMQCWQVIKEEPGFDSPTRIPAPTGVGSIDSDDRTVQMFLADSWKFEQAIRYSVLDLPVIPKLLTALGSDATAHSDKDYDLVIWTDNTPPAWIQDRCALQQAMSTDVPKGDLDMGEANYDSEFLAHAERVIADNGRGYLLVAARHIATQKLVAFSRVEYPWDNPQACFQEETLVVKEHRGRRLGMRVKAKLLAELTVVRPQATRLHTWNAGENDHMLGINTALGFTQRGLSSAWQKKLTS